MLSNLALLLGFVNTRLYFFHSGTELSLLGMDKTLETWGQSFGLLQLQKILPLHFILPCLDSQKTLLETL